MRRFAVLLGTVTLVLALFAPVASAQAPSCGLRWGSLSKSSDAGTGGHVVALRSGRHQCYDRLVFDVDGDPAGYTVEYVPVVSEDGSGNAVPLRGGAFLQVTVRAPAYDEGGRPTYTFANRNELVNVRGYSTFRQVAWAGSFEGQTSVGLGVRARLPFRVFTLDGPGSGSRVVVDVAHRW